MDQPTPEMRSERINARCSPSVKMRIEAEAEALGYDLTAYVIFCALNGKRPDPKPRPSVRAMDRAAFDQLHELGRTLNGQALAMNRGRDYTPQSILATIGAIGRVAHGDPATRVLLSPTPEDFDHPLHASDWGVFWRIGGNLTQIAEQATPGLFGDGVQVIRRFAETWARGVDAENARRKDRTR